MLLYNGFRMRAGEAPKRGRNVRLLLADDHDVVRAGVRAILESHEDWEVCGVAANGMEAARLADELVPDVVILDLEMDGLDGVAVTRRIKEHQPQIEVVVFTMHDNEFLIGEVLSAGARAFILKSDGGRTLIEAIERAVEHKPFFPAKVSETLINSFVTSRTSVGEPRLTDREVQIVQLLASGKSNKEAADLLGISMKTVETHRAAIMRKLGFKSIVELVRYAVREGLIQA
jgi:DNA-binding NarL/FixJ family response regulator